MDLARLQKPLLDLVQQAAVAILALYEKKGAPSVHLKSDHSPVTEADLAAHQILTTGLHALTPSYPILSEESASIPWSIRKTWHTYWLIDPLDGTRQFIEHSGEFSINIALIQAHAPLLGVLHIPCTGETYYAGAAWEGAYKQDAEGTITSLHVRSWSAAKTQILTSRTSSVERVDALCGHLGKLEYRYLSSAWKFALLAEGKADLSPRLGETCEWDTAAGQCILELAGGLLVNREGKPLRYNTHDSLLNPHFIALGDRRLAKHLFK